MQVFGIFVFKRNMYAKLDLSIIFSGTCMYYQVDQVLNL